MEYRLVELKEKINQIRPYKNQLSKEDLDFFESADFIVSRSKSYWDLDHLQFGSINFRINKIKNTISS